MRSPRQQALEEIRELEEELQDYEDALEESQDNADEVSSRLNRAKKRLDQETPACPCCHLEQAPIAETYICCFRCGYCEYAAEGIEEECPEAEQHVAPVEVSA